MSDIVIKAENLGKQFHIGALQKYDTLRDRIAGMFKPQAESEKRKAEDDSFWALKDVNFEIKQGEVVGVIGRNGAGKSTLLKILSKITEPTVGRVELHGRVGSLLEVGTGFHPELTGRENIFLNGAILGMKRQEIKRRFDEIVAFSEVERFIDTPVKHYSSGMYMRLAFAVAAHLDPEILLVDEVLAVGDAQFQNKCLGKMGEVAKQGRTVLFVSHNMSAVKNLCEKAILLQKGQIKCFGQVNEIVSDYINDNEAIVSKSLKRSGTGAVVFNNFTILNVDFSAKTQFQLGETCLILIETKSNKVITFAEVSIDITNTYGDLMAHITGSDDGFTINEIKPAKPNKYTIYLHDLTLPPGIYYISLWIGTNHETFERIDNCMTLTVIQGTNFIKRTYPYPRHAKTVIRSTWGCKK